MRKLNQGILILSSIMSINVLAAEESMIACNNSARELTIYTEQADNCVSESADKFKHRAGSLASRAKGVVSSCSYAINNLTEVTYNQYICLHGDQLNYGQTPKYSRPEVKKQINSFYYNKAERLLDSY